MGSNCKLRKVFGSTLRGVPHQIAEVYERLHTGFGDGIMLRAGIIANMIKYPDRRHILHVYTNIVSVFEDIEGLEIVRIKETKRMRRDKAFGWRVNKSSDLFNTYGAGRIHYLSEPCANYEALNAPFARKDKQYIGLSFQKEREYWQSPIYYPRLVVKNKDVAVPTDKRVIKSRQKIFCETIGVDFDVDNYNVTFSEEEMVYGDMMVNGRKPVVGVQIKTSTSSRDYKYMLDLAEYIAKEGASVLIIDRGASYEGKQKGIICVGHDNFRYTWAAISKCDMFIGTDSVGVHAAGSLGIPTYGIFGPTDPSCRLAGYKNADWNDKWSLPVARRGFKRGCGRQYCWYTNCKHLSCMNVKRPSYYWDDAKEKLEVL